MTIIRITERVARKTYECNACLFLFEADFRGLGATISEYREISKAKKSNGRILPGEKHEEVVYSDSGEFGTYRQKPEIDKICQKYELYPD